MKKKNLIRGELGEIDLRDVKKNQWFCSTMRSSSFLLVVRLVWWRGRVEALLAFSLEVKRDWVKPSVLREHLGTCLVLIKSLHNEPLILTVTLYCLMSKISLLFDVIINFHIEDKPGYQT